MTNVKMVALDTVHITSVSNDNLTAGTEFEIDSDTAKDLETRGIAKRVDEPADGDGPLDLALKQGNELKADAPLENKMEASPDNKDEASTGAAEPRSRRQKA